MIFPLYIGGYHHANTARCWASLTALMVSRKLPQDVPDHKVQSPCLSQSLEFVVEMRILTEIKIKNHGQKISVGKNWQAYFFF